jgi:WhiB family redox-sensing transcriptional regulator
VVALQHAVPKFTQPRWMEHAVCRDADPELFFHPDGERGPARARRDRDALRWCRQCPVIRECDTYADTFGSASLGTWGGKTEGRRRNLREGRLKTGAIR